MVHIFNQKEPLITSDIREQANVRDILSANQVEYRVKAGYKHGASGHKARQAGIKSSEMYWYRILVKKSDFEKALYLIR